jgi:hypothetical protein
MSFLSELLTTSYYLPPRVDRHFMVVLRLLALWTACVCRLGRIIRERSTLIVLERLGHQVV